jgi:hypothetical protein
MNEEARIALAQAYAARGPALWEDPQGPRQLRGLLLDYCSNGCKAEIHVLSAALDEQVPLRLLAADDRVIPVKITLEKLVLQLQRDRRIDLDAALWAVESWALALGAAAPTELAEVRSRVLGAQAQPSGPRPYAQLPALPSGKTQTQTPSPSKTQLTTPPSPKHPARTPSKPQKRRGGGVLLSFGLVSTAVAALAFSPDLRARVQGANAQETAAEETTSSGSGLRPEEAAEAPPSPPAALLTGAIDSYLPEGYALAEEPVLAGGPEGGDPFHRYRVTLRTEGSLYQVPIEELRLPSSSPAGLREVAHLLVVDPRLPAGRSFVHDGAMLVTGSGQTVDGTWRVRLEEAGGEWRVVEARPVEVVDAAGGSAGGGAILLTPAELEGLAVTRQSALAAYEARWDEIEREAAAFRARALEQVPPRCSQSTEQLLSEVVRLTSYCPTMQDTGARNACFQRRERLNSEFGSCDAMNQRHEEALARAERTATAHRRERVAAFARQLEREAASHQGY